MARHVKESIKGGKVKPHVNRQVEDKEEQRKELLGK